MSSSHRVHEMPRSERVKTGKAILVMQYGEHIRLEEDYEMIKHYLGPRGYSTFEVSSVDFGPLLVNASAVALIKQAP